MPHPAPDPPADPDPADRLADAMLEFLRGGPLPDPPATGPEPPAADDCARVPAGSAG